MLQFSYVYQLPVGRGQKFGSAMNPVLNAFIGGWQTNGIWRFDTGQPLSISLSGGVCPATYSCGWPNQIGPLKKNPKSQWLLSTTTFPNAGYFANSPPAGGGVLQVPPNYVVGNAARVQPNIRRPGTNNATLSVFKEFSLNKMREGSHLEFRVEAFNAMNHVIFSAPSSSFSGSAGNGFGNVSGQANPAREIQLALKLYF